MSDPPWTGLLWIAVAACVAPASAAHAQERSTEASLVFHVFDEQPVWEGTAEANVELEAPPELTLCRQGRVVPLDGRREVHMGCWPVSPTGHARLDVPAGPAFLAAHRGGEITWLAGLPIELHDHMLLRVHFEDRMPIRIAGWIGGAVGIVAGVICLVLSVTVAATRDPMTGSSLANVPLEVTGAALGVTGVALGVALVSWGDSIELSTEAAHDD